MSVVVAIRDGIRIKRQNRAEDQQTISLRRIIGTAEAAAFARDEPNEGSATALAVTWAMERKLPSAQLRIIAGTLDERTDFQVRLAEVEIARAESEAHSAKVRRARVLHGNEEADAMLGEYHRTFERFRQCVADLANSPATTRRDLDTKRAAIGRVWLVAEGAWYDALRAAVARDEARLAAPKHGRA